MAPHAFILRYKTMREKKKNKKNKGGSDSDIKKTIAQPCEQHTQNKWHHIQKWFFFFLSDSSYTTCAVPSALHFDLLGVAAAAATAVMKMEISHTHQNVIRVKRYNNNNNNKKKKGGVKEAERIIISTKGCERIFFSREKKNMI